MGQPEQYKLAWTRDLERSERRDAQRAFIDGLDEQIGSAMKRWEASLPGLDAYKQMADELTDDAERPVSTTQVYDWLARRNGRRPPGELVFELFAGDDKFAAWWCERAGYEPPKKKIAVPVEEQVRALRSALQRFGEAGEAEYQRALFGPVNGAKR